MLIGPVIFCTVVLGIVGAGDMRKVGRVGGKALLYFELVSSVALLIGLVVVNVIRPGSGFNVDPRTLDAKAVDAYAKTCLRRNRRQTSCCTSFPRHSPTP
jgi:aerobic C4-dicarboxylate transport protein